VRIVACIDDGGQQDRFAVTDLGWLLRRRHRPSSLTDTPHGAMLLMRHSNPWGAE
jgi:hypothetical protein